MILDLHSLPMYCTAEGQCLLWNLGTNNCGAPIARLDGRVWLVRRYVASELLGKPIGGKWLQACCGNRLCVSPRCVQVSTPSKVVADSYKTGARTPARETARGRAGVYVRGWSRLTIDDARYVRSSDKPYAELAAELRCTVENISKIRRGRTWVEASPFAGLGQA